MDREQKGHFKTKTKLALIKHIQSGALKAYLLAPPLVVTHLSQDEQSLAVVPSYLRLEVVSQRSTSFCHYTP